MSKTCHGCDSNKPLADFYRDSRRRDGRQTRCKDCQRQKRQEWAEENREQQRELLRAWDRKNPESRAAVVQRDREKSPERHQARYTLRNAVSSGKIKKPTSCEQCGRAASGKLLHGHHEDYSKPLEVEWLCASCHSHRHKEKATRV